MKVYVKQLHLGTVPETLRELGVDPSGRVQKAVTMEINKRITEYMPYRTGMLATKSKSVVGTTQIIVQSPYALYQYFGVAMKGRPPKVATDKPLIYDQNHNPKAGPYWDVRMMAEQAAVIVQVAEAAAKRGSGE